MLRQRSGTIVTLFLLRTNLALDLVNYDNVRRRAIRCLRHLDLEDAEGSTRDHFSLGKPRFFFPYVHYLLHETCVKGMEDAVIPAITTFWRFPGSDLAVSMLASYGRSSDPS